MHIPEDEAERRRLNERGREILRRKNGAVRPHREDGYVNLLNKYGTKQDNSEAYFLLNNAENGLVWNWALKGNKEKLYLTDSNGSGSIVPAETGTYAITLDIASLTFTMDKQ